VSTSLRGQDRIAGALLGVHAGDALGASLEFSSWTSIRARYPDGLREIVGGGPFDWEPGQATDDTDLTRAVVLAYLSPTDDVVRAAADHMINWLDGDCCIPTALVVGDRDERIRHSMEISAITHDDRRCTVACASYNEMAAALLAGAAPPDAVAVGHAVAAELGCVSVAESIDRGSVLRPAVLATTGPTSLADEAGGFVLDSLSLAVASVLDSRPLRDVVVDIVRLGNDTDTNGAIAGGLLGVRDGAEAIPFEWRTKLQFAEEFVAAAKAFGS
jgi:ADP-ribosylglycohydrolase